MSDSNPKPNKEPLGLIPYVALKELALGLQEGAEKYAPWDYRRTGIKVSVYVGAALRHLAKFGNGETIDPDSPTGKTHLAGALASLAIIADGLELGYATDDRPTKENIADDYPMCPRCGTSKHVTKLINHPMAGRYFCWYRPADGFEYGFADRLAASGGCAGYVEVNS